MGAPDKTTQPGGARDESPRAQLDAGTPQKLLHHRGTGTVSCSEVFSSCFCSLSGSLIWGGGGCSPEYVFWRWVAPTCLCPDLACRARAENASPAYGIELLWVCPFIFFPRYTPALARVQGSSFQPAAGLCKINLEKRTDEELELLPAPHCCQKGPGLCSQT